MLSIRSARETLGKVELRAVRLRGLLSELGAVLCEREQWRASRPQVAVLRPEHHRWQRRQPVGEASVGAQPVAL